MGKTTRWDNDPVAQLSAFRDGYYKAWTGWADTGFELCDAVLCATGPVTSLPGLSLERECRRGHGSVYKCLTQGGVNPEAMRDLLTDHLPPGPLVFAVDATAWPRRDAETSPHRGYCYDPIHTTMKKPIVAGWSYQWIAALDMGTHSSWTAPVDVTRLPPGVNTTKQTVTQITNLVTRLTTRRSHNTPPVFVFDAGYDAIGLTHELRTLKATLVIRVRCDRVFHSPPPPRAPGTNGRPLLHGPRHSCAEPDTWPTPHWSTTINDPHHGLVHVQAWHNLHPKIARPKRRYWGDNGPPPIIEGTVIRITTTHPIHNRGPLWLWVGSGGGHTPNLTTCWKAYLHRFDIEHTFRFKQTLGWTTPTPRTPEQADTWTWTITAALTQLRLARPLVADHHLPWERPQPPHQLTPTRVRRGFRGIITPLGTPANPPKPSKAGPGRPKGTTKPPRTRHPVIKTGPTKHAPKV